MQGFCCFKQELRKNTANYYQKMPLIFYDLIKHALLYFAEGGKVQGITKPQFLSL